jgi:glycine cleavage system transcriptional repressor
VGVTVAAGSRVAVTAFGPDQPGIVATVTGVLMGHGANLEDTSMTILQGHFAMMLVVALPPGEGPEALEQALSDEVGRLGLTVVVRALGDGTRAHDGTTSWAVSVYGSDRPGIVHRVTEVLAENNANIIDLSTRLVGDVDAGTSAYVMLLEVELPASADIGHLDGQLAALREELGVEVHLRPDDADVL